MLWAAGEITLHDAVDELWTDAVHNGLVAQLGVNKAQELLGTAFCAMICCATKMSATLRAAEYLLLGDLERWKKWFDAHTAPK